MCLVFHKTFHTIFCCINDLFCIVNHVDNFFSGHFTRNIESSDVMFIKVLKIVYSNIVHLHIDSISFTEVPSTLKGLFRQRKKWARGMIEAFKKVPVLTSKQMNWKFRILMLFNVLFPFVDLVLLIFVPVGLLFLIFGNQLLVGWLTLFVVLLGLILCLVIGVRRCNALCQVECKLERRSFFAFFSTFYFMHSYLLQLVSLDIVQNFSMFGKSGRL